MGRGGIAALVAVVGLMASGATGCTTGSAAPSVSGSGRATAVASTDAARPGSSASAVSSPGATSPASASGPECLDHDIRTVLGQLYGAGGHDGYLLEFTDVSGHGCHLTGYPGVRLVSNDGRFLAAANQTLTGYLGGAEGMREPPVVTLESGQTVAALVEWDEAYAGNDPRPTGCYSDADAEFQVTAPGSTLVTTLYFPTISVMCAVDLEVHPVLGGDYGRPPGT